MVTYFGKNGGEILRRELLPHAPILMKFGTDLLPKEV